MILHTNMKNKAVEGACKKQRGVKSSMLLYTQNIAQNQSFAQKGIGVKYMDDLPRCPTTYWYTNAFSTL